jgi:hypothetical protein
LFLTKRVHQENECGSYPLNYKLQRYGITLYNSKLGISCMGGGPTGHSSKISRCDEVETTQSPVERSCIPTFSTTTVVDFCLPLVARKNWREGDTFIAITEAILADWETATEVGIATCTSIGKGVGWFVL